MGFFSIALNGQQLRDRTIVENLLSLSARHQQIV